MALIKLTASELEGVKSQISKMSSKASECANRTASVRNNLDMEISAKRNIEERLDNIKRDLTKHSESLKSYANVLNDVINEFVREDSKGSILQTLPDWFKNGSVIGAAGVAGAMIMAKPMILLPPATDLNLQKIANAANLFGDSSVQKEETGFWGSLWNKGKEAVEKIGDKAKEAYGNVVQATKDCVSWVKEKYDEKGAFYTAVQYGQAAVKVAAGVGAIVVSAGAIAASGGAASPLAVASIAYGINDIASGVKDAIDITADVKSGGAGDIEENNLMKDGMEFIVGGAGGAIGEVLGNAELGEEIGEKIGAVAYDAGKIATTIYNISTGWDQIHQAQDFNLQGMADEVGDAAKHGWDLATKVEFNSLSDVVKVDLSSPLTSNIIKMGDGLKYQLSLIGNELPNTVNAIQNVSLINTFANNVVGNPVEIIEGLFTNDIPEPGGIVGHIKDAFETFTS